MQSAKIASARSVRQIWWCLPLMLGLVGSKVPLHSAANATAMVSAARADDLAAVRNLVKERADVNAPAGDGSTALLWAAYHSNTDMAKALLAAGAAVDTANRYGVNPLLQASRNGDVAVMRVLLDAGAQPTRWHAEGETPLMAASRTGNVEAVKLLLTHGSFVNATDAFQEQTALMWASAEGHVEAVKALLAADADPNLKAHVSLITDRKNADHPSGGFTALMFAARNGHVEVVRALMKGGADPKLTNADGMTATGIAIVNDRLDLAKELLDLGADPNDGALFFAVDMHDATTDTRAQDATRMQPDHDNNLTALGLVKALLDLGADVNKPFTGAMHSTSMCCGPSINNTALFRAATAADVEVLKLLLAKGADVDASPAEIKPKDSKRVPPALNANVGRTPAMAAMRGGNGPALQAGPGYSRNGPPPYREPGSREPIDALNVLLAAGANPNAKAPDGSTLLHQAVQAQQVSMIRALVAKGAALDGVDKDNLTPLGAAEKLKSGPPEPVSVMGDPGAYRRKRDTREEVVAALRELMRLGPDDPVPAPPPAAVKPNQDKQGKQQKGKAAPDTTPEQ